MDFIEKIFGVSPDGGNGLFEVMLFVIPLAILSIVMLLRRKGSPPPR
jgi:hypothetical protein